RILRLPLWLVAVLACIGVIIGLSVPTFTARPEAIQNGLRTPLAMYWLLPAKLWNVPSVMWFFDIGGIACGRILLVFCLRVLSALAHARPEKVLLGGAGIALLCLHFVYSQLSDTYVAALIPFGLIAVGEGLRSFPQASALVRAST